MNRLKNNLPNAITCLNLLFGCIAIVDSFRDNWTSASWWIIAAAIADLLDGMVARALQVHSDIGKELDSLADIISFGAAPGMLLFQLISNPPYSWIALSIPVCASLRLAKFNTDHRQVNYFIGLPTPANALLIASLPLIIAKNNTCNNFYLSHAIVTTLFLVLIAILGSILMISNIKLFSLKMKDTNWLNNKVRYIFGIVSLITLLFLGYAAIPLILLFYILLSLFNSKYITNT